MNGALPSHYARALADAVFAPGSGLAPNDAVSQFRLAESLLSGSKDLHRVLLSPAVKKTKKQAVIGKLADELGLHRLIRNFLLVVVSHRRTGDLTAMRQDFEAIADERQGWIPAEIASARELDPEQRQEIERVLGGRAGKLIRARYIVDPSLLGGVRARLASREYDATVRGKLETLRARLVSHL
jgi:F-type H+-transporting ATPase subunit delta